MSRKDSPQSVIDSYRKRQQMAPYFMAGLAVLLVVVGIIILVVWFTGSGKGKVAGIALLASPTPTVTITSTATSVPPTATATTAPTQTITATVTQTVTPSGPFEYKVLDGDTCWDIAVTKFKVDFSVFMALNNFGNDCPIKPGDKILIPQAGASLPTDTPIPANMTGKIEYTIQMGDTLALIAKKFNTTQDAIIKENKIKDASKINFGDKLIIPVNIVTPTVTKAPTKTITPGGPTLTPKPSATATKKP